MLNRVLSVPLLLASFSLVAQGGFSPMEHGRMGFGPGGGDGMRAPVTNAPYSATYTSTSTERLQDGTVLTHTSTRTVTRDSLGRTREEITAPVHGSAGTTRTTIVISDPVAHTLTQLRPDEKTAIVHTAPQPGQAHYSHGTTLDGTSAASGTARVRPNELQADLGSKTISGVVATGKRTTRTIPPGEMGNATPLVSTRETWYSPDLKIELSSSETDPFRCSRSMTILSLSKTEPDAALFQVPSGFAVQQAPAHAFMHRGPGGPHGNELPAPHPGA